MRRWPSSQDPLRGARRDRSRRARLHRRARAVHAGAAVQARAVPAPGARPLRAGRLLAGVAGVLDRQLARATGTGWRSPTRSRARSRRAWSASWPPGGSVWVKLPYGEFVVDPAQRRGAVRRRDRHHRVHGVPAVARARARPARPAVLRRPHAGPVRLRSPRAGLRARGAVARPAAWSARRPTAAWRWTPPGRPSRRCDDPVFYLSGPPPMLAALTAQLRGRGVSPDAIRTDAWE